MRESTTSRFFSYRNLMAVFKRLSGGALFFPMLFFISCTSYHVASHEGRTSPPLIDSEGNQSTPSQQCRPISEGLYVVQAGAFKNISYAQALRKNLEDKGYDSYITVSGFDEEKRIFRVLIGKFADVQQAQRLSGEIKKKENIDVIVALKPPRDKFVVQAGCFAEMAKAKDLRKKLANHGHNAYIILSEAGNEKTYNVLLGEFLNRAEAEKISGEIREKEHIQVFVNTM